MSLVRHHSDSKLIIDPELTHQLLLRFLENETHKAGFTKGVIALSGGLDSTTAAYLSVSALGPDNVFGLSMPGPNLLPERDEYAQIVAAELGISCETIDIGPVVEALTIKSGEINTARKDKISARIRMSMLYDRAETWHGLVIGSNNKSDLLLGNGTIFGDLACALNPLGDLYETQIRQLAHFVGVPSAIIDENIRLSRHPAVSGDQTRGIDYGTVDPILHMIVDERYSLQDLLEDGYDRVMLIDIVTRIRRSQFKRTLPIIPKLTGRTVGHDFRYLRDWGT